MAVDPLQPSDPQRLGDYELVGRLGAGGMGVVYLGQGPGGQRAAVKLVRADLAHDATFRERFRREVEALRRVSGPRVARLLAADTEADQPYLVVEYVDGPTLADAVATAGPLPGPRLRALAAGLAEALAVIHEAGVIHRDLKPSNIILAADQPKLVDFGIAAASGAIPLTMAGTVIGSAGWMAPEQAAGQVSTAAVDVFAWASLVAYAGTGRPPFGIGSPEAVTARILNGSPDLEGLPQDVRPFVEAGFIRDPQQRPSAKAVLAGIVGHAGEASTNELVQETTHLIENTWFQPAAAAGPPPTPSPPEKRHRGWIVAAVIVGLLALLTGIAAALVLAGDDDPDDEAVATPASPTTTEGPVVNPLEPGSDPQTTTTEGRPAGEIIDSPIELEVDVISEGVEDVGLDPVNGLTCDGSGGEFTSDTRLGLENADGDVLIPPAPLDEGVLEVEGEFFPEGVICVFLLTFELPVDEDAYVFVADGQPVCTVEAAALNPSVGLEIPTDC